MLVPPSYEGHQPPKKYGGFHTTIILFLMLKYLISFFDIFIYFIYFGIVSASSYLNNENKNSAI